MIYIAILFAAAAFDPTPTQQGRELLAQQVAACGLRTDQFSIDHDEEMNLDEITVSTLSADVTGGLFECLARIERGGTWFAFDARQDEDRLASASTRLFGGADDLARRTRAESWLRERGLIERIPTFDRSKDTIEDFASKINRLCGYGDETIVGIDIGSQFVLTMPTPQPDPSDDVNYDHTCFLHLAVVDEAIDQMAFGGLYH